MSKLESNPARTQGKKIRKNGQGSTYFDNTRKKWVSEIVDLNGKRQKDAFDLQEDADQWRIKNVIAREKGELPFSKNPKQTVHEFLVDWLEYRKPKIAPSTYRYYDIAIRNRIVPYLGKMRAGQLKPELIEKAVESLVSSGKADGTIRSFYSTMSKAYSDGVRLGWVPYNPMLKVERRKLNLNPSKPIPRVDTDKLFSVANSSATDLARLIAGVSLGLRPGTVAGLRWSDFDFNEEIVWIRRQAQYIKGEGLVYCPPKTPMLEPIPLDKNEVKAFLQHKEIQELQKSVWAGKVIKGECAWKGDEEIVFPNAYGNLQNAKSDTRWFKQLCESAGIPVYQRYQMRKRAFTDLMMATNLANVMAYSGHTQSSTLLKHYISPELEDVRLAIKKRQEITQYSKERPEESHDKQN